MKIGIIKFLTVVIISLYACKKPPYKVDYKNIGGYVIRKEICNSNENSDYWILDFTVYPNTPAVGDTLQFAGQTYTNVLKVKGLDPRLQQIGMMVSIDYKTISSNKITTTNCTASAPETYALKEIYIINQFEIR